MESVTGGSPRRPETPWETLKGRVFPSVQGKPEQGPHFPRDSGATGVEADPRCAWWPERLGRRCLVSCDSRGSGVTLNIALGVTSGKSGRRSLVVAEDAPGRCTWVLQTVGHGGLLSPFAQAEWREDVFNSSPELRYHQGVGRGPQLCRFLVEIIVRNPSVIECTLNCPD